MFNSDGIIIYVGKAKILQNRLKSYFTGRVLGKTKKMVSEVDHFEYIVTNTETEAFVLELNLSTLKDMKVSKMKYKEISKYPGISKDMAFILDDKITSEEVMKTIKKAGGKLVTSIRVFDLYKGNNLDKNKKSLAFNLYFEDK